MCEQQCTAQSVQSVFRLNRLPSLSESLHFIIYHGAKALLSLWVICISSIWLLYPLETLEINRRLHKRANSEDHRAPDKRFHESNSKIIFLFLNKNIYCDPSLELSTWDSSNDGWFTRYVFMEKYD